MRSVRQNLARHHAPGEGANRADPEPLLARLLASVPEDLDRFTALCGDVEDWDALFQSAIAHGVHGVLYHYVRRVPCRVTPDVEHRAGQQHFFQRVWLESARESLYLATAELETASIPVVPLKGPVLAERLYPDPLVRPSIDLDLLVAEGDLDRAIGALGAIGYEFTNDPRERFYRKYRHHLHLSHRQRPTIELHFRAFANFGTVMPAEALIERGVAHRTAQGVQVRVLLPEDELLYLVAHAVGHFVVQLSWLYDLKLFLGKHPGLDWPAAWDRARALGLATAFSLGLADLRRHLGVVVPEAGNAAARPARLRTMDRLRAASVASENSGLVGTLARTVFTVSMCDRWTSSASFLRRQCARAARRRARRLLPGAFPDEWSV